MINHQTQLKVQAYLDGELSAGEARAVEELLRSDAAAQELHQELRIARSFLAGNELERKLPESPEFYWSNIRRQIERAESAPDGLSEPTPTPWWSRFLAPAGVLGALAVFVALVLRSPQDGGARGTRHAADLPGNLLLGLGGAGIQGQKPHESRHRQPRSLCLGATPGVHRQELRLVDRRHSDPLRCLLERRRARRRLLVAGPVRVDHHLCTARHHRGTSSAASGQCFRS